MKPEDSVLSKRAATVPGLEDLAYLVMLQRWVSIGGLARILRISRSSAARLVGSLRKKGVRVVSVRENGSWHYEIRNSDEIARKRWKKSRLRAMAGFARARRDERLKEEDQAIYA